MEPKELKKKITVQGKILREKDFSSLKMEHCSGQGATQTTTNTATKTSPNRDSNSYARVI